jgi:hypothetical protein
MTPPEVQADIGALLDRLAGLGCRVVRAHYSPENFGNWVVDIAGPLGFSMSSDRGQYMIDADRDALERANLWRAFDDREEFVRSVLAWVTASIHPA